MNRAKPNYLVLRMLLSVLLLSLISTAVAQAQANKTTLATSIKQSRSAVGISPHVFVGLASKLPAGVTTRVIPQSDIAPNKVTRAVGDSAVIRQTILLTNTTPTIQDSFSPIPAQSEHPFWTQDERYIYFDSDRVSATNNTESPTLIHNIYYSLTDGSGVTQVLTDTQNNELDPSVSADGGTLAYVSGGTISYGTIPAGLDSPTTAGFNLYTYTLNGANPTHQLTSLAGGQQFTDVRHPSWAPSGTAITFAGQTVANGPYHIYQVNVQSGVITQLTSGPANDTSPAWSPDGNVIAFTSSATSFTAAIPPASAGANAADITGNPRTDIWVINSTFAIPDPKKVTNSSAIAGGLVSSNKNASWSSLQQDPLGIIPNQNQPAGNVVSINLLAFASNRAAADPTNNPGKATAIEPTFDIWFMHAHVAKDGNTGAYTVITPETVGNAPLWLQTSTPDTAIDPNDPSSMFDPGFKSNEDYPTWPQYLNSYRIVFQSDRGTSSTVLSNYNELFASEIFDINAPSLLKYNPTTNDIVDVSENSNPGTSIKQANPGDTLRFRTSVVDYQTGVQSVYIQIKCPNSAQKDPNGQEHKIYYTGSGLLDTAPLSVVNAPFEWDYQAIQPYNNSARGSFRAATGTTANPQGVSAGDVFFFGNELPQNGWPGFNQYVPGFDDVQAFSGGSHPPDNVETSATVPGNDYTGQGSFWLQMWDDGPISKGGHEPEGETAGDGIYTNTWTAPSALPSDWVIDVIARDNAIDPFDTTQTINWKIYDNVGGFTTAQFTGTAGILYVDEYDSGQRFFQAHLGSATSLFSFSGLPTGSWMTEFSQQLFPNSANDDGKIYPLINFETALGLNSYTDAYQGPNVQSGQYDIWRIQCRGPLPQSTLNTYLGHLETLPVDGITGETAPKQVWVATKCVFWHSPYTGDMFVGPGTILDTSTQAELVSFINAGGRLFLCGQDVAWGLSLGQSGGTSPLLSALHVSFASDVVAEPIPPIVPTGGMGTSPIVTQTWYNNYHNFPGANPYDPPSNGDMYLETYTPTPVPRDFMCENQVSPDAVTFTGTIAADLAGVDATYGGTPCIMWVTNPAAVPVVAKTVFSPFGWEAVNPEYVSLTGPVYELLNRRTEMLHNVGDYLRTGSIFGNVYSVNGSGAQSPVAGVLIRAVPSHPLAYLTGGGAIASVSLSLSDGSYTLDGLDPTGAYTVNMFKAGYIATHVQGTLFHGSTTSRVDGYLALAQPGSLSGTVTKASDGTPVAGLILVATSTTLSTDVYTATSQSNGTYTFPSLPNDTYLVTTPNSPTGNLNTLGYGSSTSTYNGVTSTTGATVAVAPMATVTGVNFKVTQLPGGLTGTVRAHNPSNPTAPSTLIAGATVTAVNAVASANLTYTAVTNSAGVYDFGLTIAPGTYNVTANAAGYAPSNTLSAIVVTNVDKELDFIDSPAGQNALVTIPPGSIAGIVANSNGTPVGGATVTVTNAGGVVLATGTTTGSLSSGTKASGTGTINYQYNYLITGIPAGATVNVSAAESGYTPDPAPSQSVTVVSDNNTSPLNTSINIDFTINALLTIPVGLGPDGQPLLNLVSAPYEYSGIGTGNVADLLGIPSADRTDGAFQFATWNATKGAYINYPTPPADDFHLGDGYFVADANLGSLSITTMGAPANGGSTTQTYPISLKVGWNLIGDPFPFSLNFLNLSVLQADGTTTDVYTAQTSANPTLGSALWDYILGVYQVSYTMDPWLGYWLRAFDNRPTGSQTGTPTIQLIVDPAQRQNRSVGKTAVDSRAVLAKLGSTSSGWQLTLSANAAGTASAPAILGTNAGATDNYDRFKLLAPPTVSKRSVSLAFSHTDWGAQSGAYAVDLRSASTPSHQWNFTVTSNVVNEPVVLTWPSLATLNKRQDVILTDLDANTTVDLRTRATYSIAASTTAITHHFMIQDVPTTRSPLQLANVQAHQNLTRAAGVLPTVGISYTLSTNATVRTTILLNGKRVRTVETGSTRAAGTAQVVWDGRDDQGHPLGSDVYNVEVYAQDSQGHTVRQVLPLLVTGR